MGPVNTDVALRCEKQGSWAEQQEQGRVGGARWQGQDGQGRMSKTGQGCDDRGITHRPGQTRLGS